MGDSVSISFGFLQEQLNTFNIFCRLASTISQKHIQSFKINIQKLFPITSNGYLHWCEGLSIMQSYKIFKMSWGFYLFISHSVYEYHTIVRNYYYIQSKSDKGINVCVFLLASIAYDVEYERHAFFHSVSIRDTYQILNNWNQVRKKKERGIKSVAEETKHWENVKYKAIYTLTERKKNGIFY